MTEKNSIETMRGTNEQYDVKPETKEPIQPDWLIQLAKERKIAREKAIKTSQILSIFKTKYYDAEASYKDAVTIYNSLDKEYTMAVFKRKQKTKVKSSKPYNASKRTAAKALKALESLPEELRARVIANAQKGLF